MNIVFRVDASHRIGSGHLMRCLTLARALREQGAACHFVCREHPGHLAGLVEHQGFGIKLLPLKTQLLQSPDQEPIYDDWLGASRDDDAADCRQWLDTLDARWLVCDHYGIDATWERQITRPGLRLLVIDDLANRQHHCDVLLDQNLGHGESHYRPLVDSQTRLLIGPRYALLRPEFLTWRQHSLERRRTTPPQSLLISLGGVDERNDTERCLDAIDTLTLAPDFCIDVVLGAQSIWLDSVRQRAARMRHTTHVHVQIDNMAQRMAISDIAIGAGGGTSWERCCLGLPTLAILAADNQRSGLQALTAAGAVAMLEPGASLTMQLRHQLSRLDDAAQRMAMVRAGADLVDGQGVRRVLESLQ